MRTLRGACNLVNSSVPGCLPSLGRFHYSPSFEPRASEKLPSCPSLERLRSCLQRGHQFGSDKTLVKILCRSGHPYVREPFSTPPSSRLAATPDVSPSVAVLRRTRAPLSAGGGGGPRLDSGFLSDHSAFFPSLLFALLCSYLRLAAPRVMSQGPQMTWAETASTWRGGCQGFTVSQFPE